MISVSKIKLYLYILCVALIALMPASISTSFTLNMGYRGIRLNIIIVLIILIVTSISEIHKKIKWEIYEVAYVIFCFVVFSLALIKSIFSIETVAIFSVMETMLVLLIPFILYKRLSSYTNEEDKNIIFKSLVGIGIIIVIQVLMYTLFYTFISQLMNWDPSKPERPSTTIGAATSTALFLYAILGISFYKMINSRGKYYKITTILLVIAILFLQTRSAIFLTVLFAIYIIFNNRSKLNKRYILYFVTALTVLYLSIPETINPIFERFFTDQSKGSNEARIYLLNIGIEAFKETPVLGTGIGRGVTRLIDTNELTTQITNPHNQHLALLLETGLVGYIFYLFFIATLFFFYIKKNLKNGSYNYLLFATVSLLLIGFMVEVLVTAGVRTSMSFWLLLVTLKLNDT